MAVFIERFNGKLFHKINKPMYINSDGNWINILKDAVVMLGMLVNATFSLKDIHLIEI